MRCFLHLLLLRGAEDVLNPKRSDDTGLARTQRLHGATLYDRDGDHVAWQKITVRDLESEPTRYHSGEGSTRIAL